MVAALADEPLATGIADQLFRIALDVDIQLAAEWVPILRSVVQRGSLDELKSRLRRWMAQGGGAVELGLKAVLAARFGDFADEFWRRLESDDHQVVLSTYRMLEPFPIEVLGAEWRTRVSRWPPEQRAESAIDASAASTHDALRLAKDFASREPSPMVRGKCLAHIAFYDRSAAERLFTGATGESVAEILKYGASPLDLLSREAVNRHLPYIKRLARTLPINHLGSCALSYLREIDPVRVVDIYKQQISEERLDTHQQRAILEFIAQYDRQWVGHWVVKRLIAFDYLPEDFGQFLVDLDDEEFVNAVDKYWRNRPNLSARHLSGSFSTARSPLDREQLPR